MGRWIVYATLAGLGLAVAAPPGACAQEGMSRAAEADPPARQLDSDDWKARMAAVRRLAQEGVPALPSLGRALQDAHPSVREAAAAALGRIGSREALPPLATALEDPDTGVRNEAERALGDLLDSFIDELDSASDSAVWEAARGIRELSMLAVDRLEDAEARSEAEDLLTEVAEAATDALDDLDRDTRRAGAEILMDLVAALADVLEDGGLLARRSASDVLETTIAEVAELLDDGNPDVRERAAEVLARAIHSLAEVLRDARLSGQREAEDLLGGVLDQLATALGSGDGDARRTGIALAREAGVVLEEAGRRGGLRAEHAAESYRERLAAALGERLTDPQWQVRRDAAVALGDLGSAASVEPLIRALEDPQRAVRESAADALRDLTGERFGTDVGKWKEWVGR